MQAISAVALIDAGVIEDLAQLAGQDRGVLGNLLEAAVGGQGHEVAPRVGFDHGAAHPQFVQQRRHARGHVVQADDDHVAAQPPGAAPHALDHPSLDQRGGHDRGGQPQGDAAGQQADRRHHLAAAVGLAARVAQRSAGPLVEELAGPVRRRVATPASVTSTPSPRSSWVLMVALASRSRHRVIVRRPRRARPAGGDPPVRSRLARAGAGRTRGRRTPRRKRRPACGAPGPGRRPVALRGGSSRPLATASSGRPRRRASTTRPRRGAPAPGSRRGSGCRPGPAEEAPGAPSARAGQRIAGGRHLDLLDTETYSVPTRIVRTWSRARPKSTAATKDGADRWATL